MDPVPRSPAPAQRLLIVDDDVHSIRLLSCILDGYAEIVFATSGAQALQLIRAQPPDLVLLDTDMPGMSGLDVCACIRGEPAWADLPVIFVTAHHGAEEETRALECGAVDFIPKPVNPPVVRARVRTHLALRQRTDALHRRQQQALEASETRFKALFETMSEAFCLLEVVPDAWHRPCDLRLLAANPACERHTGQRVPALLGRTLRELHPAIAPAWIERLARVASTGEPLQFEGRYAPCDCWFEVSAYQTQPGYCAVLLSNISGRKAMEEALRQRTVQAEAASRAKTAFLANMSHEFRTPLNAVVGLSQLLTQMALPEKARGFVGHLRQAADQLMALANDVLDLAKIEAGELLLERVPFQPEALLRSVHAMVQPQAEAKGLALRLDLAPELPARLVGDPLRLKQVLLNLVSNALKFTRQGRVTLRARLPRLDPARATLHLEVEDTGIGIDAVLRERLFEPFTQGDDSTTRRHGGTGLGLVLVRRLVGLMGGQVQLDSELGRGSTFAVTLELEVAADGCDASLPA